MVSTCVTFNFFHFQNFFDKFDKNKSDSTDEVQEGAPEPKKCKSWAFCSYKMKMMSKLVCKKCMKSMGGDHKIDVSINCFTTIIRN